MSKEKIFMDRVGIQKLEAEIEALRNEISRKITFNCEDTTDKYNTGIAEENRHTGTLIELLELRLNTLSRVELIEKQENSDLIDLDDNLEVEFNGENNRLIFKLVGRDGDPSKELPEISINSPLGRAVYQKKVGDECTYVVNGRILSVTIIQKLTLSDTIETIKR